MTEKDTQLEEQNKDTRGRGRPLKYESVKDLTQAIRSYFDSCDPHVEPRVVDGGINQKGETIWLKREVLTEQKPYTMSGLARGLGISRQTLLDYSEREEFMDSIADAKARCEEYAESQLFGPYSNGAKFNLVNNYRGKYQVWADKQELTGADDAPLMPIGLDAAILARITNGAATPSSTDDSSEPS